MRVLCFGDSNTYGYDPRSFLGGRYPQESRWVDILAGQTGWDIFNGGENGREIPTRKSELERFDYLLSAAKTELLIVMLGGNDLLQGLDANGAGDRMDAFLGHIPLLPEQILVITPPPVQWGAWVTEERLLTESVRLFDVYSEITRKYGIECLDAGKWGITLTYDGVHFDEMGHRNFAAEILSYLNSMK